MTARGSVLKPRGERISEPIFVVTAGSGYRELCFNLRKRLAAPRSMELASLTEMGKRSAPQQPTTLFVSRLADISRETLEHAGVDATTRQLVFLEGLPVEAVAARLLPLNIRNPGRIHIAARRDQASMEGLIFRLFRGLTELNDSHSIVDAWVENQSLVLLSPTFSRLTVSFEKLARFVGEAEKKIAAFEIDEDGRFLYWPHADVHLGWTQIEQIIDPSKVVTEAKKTLKYNQRYGKAIRAVRESMGLKQTEIQGITERQLRRVESGQQGASKSTLEALANAHSMSLGDYVGTLAKQAATIA